MYCVACGKEVALGASFCSSCGASAPSTIEDTRHVSGGANVVRVSAPLWLFCLIGGMVGAIAAYLTRPSAILIGQLPFGTVITAGANLQGFDQILVPIAQQSFNQMLTGLIVGAVLGGVAGAILRQLKSRTP